ncbi:hypothetical protein [Novipirellula caenicola]|uniref:Type II secretion system protein G n=1 Tax=Novipirellula caenicola TaxID=1536901 RepID=A0ABP9VKK7_9BACT
MLPIDRLAAARRGFTLAEMTVIALLIGIVVTLAAPRMLPDGDPVNDVPSRRQLAILRNAIEMYRAHAGFYPPANKLPEVMETLLHEPLASPVYSPLQGRNTVYYDLDRDVAEEVVPQPNAKAGWAYKPANGTLKFNVSSHDVSANW